MTNKKAKQIKRILRNTLQTYILSDMFEYTIYCDTNCTCEEIGDMYIEMMTELIKEYVNDQHLYTNYMNRNK